MNRQLQIIYLVNHATMPVVEIMDPFILEKLMEYSTISPYPVSIAELLENGNKEIYSEEQSYKFLKKQVAVRLAHMVMELQHLPKELHAEKKCRSTMEKYCQSFDEIIQFEKKDPAPVVLKDFMEFLFKFKDRHHQVRHPQWIIDNPDLHLHCTLYYIPGYCSLYGGSLC